MKGKGQREEDRKAAPLLIDIYVRLLCRCVRHTSSFYFSDHRRQRAFPFISRVSLAGTMTRRRASVAGRSVFHRDLENAVNWSETRSGTHLSLLFADASD